VRATPHRGYRRWQSAKPRRRSTRRPWTTPCSSDARELRRGRSAPARGRPGRTSTRRIPVTLPGAGRAPVPSIDRLHVMDPRALTSSTAEEYQMVVARAQPAAPWPGRARCRPALVRPDDDPRGRRPMTVHDGQKAVRRRRERWPWGTRRERHRPAMPRCRGLGPLSVGCSTLAQRGERNVMLPPPGGPYPVRPVLTAPVNSRPPLGQGPPGTGAPVGRHPSGGPISCSGEGYRGRGSTSRPPNRAAPGAEPGGQPWVFPCRPPSGYRSGDLVTTVDSPPRS